MLPILFAVAASIGACDYPGDIGGLSGIQLIRPGRIPAGVAPRAEAARWRKGA